MTTGPFIEREEAAGDAADLWTHQQGYAMTGTEWGAFEQGYLAGSAWALREYADALAAVPDYAPSPYDKGRVDQRHMMATELLERATDIEKGN